jgi:hypothetical protein
MHLLFHRLELMPHLLHLIPHLFGLLLKLRWVWLLRLWHMHSQLHRTLHGHGHGRVRRALR